MQIVTLQTDFTTGELDPKLRARADIDQYRSGLATAINVTIQPQGGAKRRPGTRFVAALPSDTGTGCRLVPFEFSTTTSYMLAFTPGRMYVFRNGALVTNINGSGNSYLAIASMTASIISSMCWTQSYDTLIITHEDLAPLKIFRGGSDTAWTASSLTLTYVPRYNFSSFFAPPRGTITPSDVSGNVTLTASYTPETGTAQAGSTSTTIKLVSTANTTTDFYKGLYIETTGGTGSGQTRLITAYNGSTLVATVDQAWTTTPDATTTYTISVFNAASIGQYVSNTESFGRARITSVTSTTVAKARVVIPFFDKTAIANGKWQIEAGYELVWSATRGYPRTVCFYGGRLYFGGSKTRPSTVWGSKVGDYFNFDPASSLADEAVEATADTGQYNAIVDMYSGRSLQVFTVGAEFFCPQPTDDPITPSTFFLKVQTENGSKPGIRVVNVEGGTIFIQRQGKTLQEFIYANTEQAYTAAKISLLSSHLLKTPTTMAMRQSTSTDEGDRLLIVNGDDGSISCYTLLRSQKVIAPSQWVTDGSFLSAGVDVDTAYCIVKRTVGGTSVYYVETFDETLQMDSARQATVGVSTASVATLSHLEGKTVDVVRDGVIEADKTVASGTITFERAATASYQIGLPYTVLMKTLPVAPKTQAGSIRGSKKRVYDIIIDLYDTQSLNVQGREVSFRSFGTSVLDQSVQSYTGLKRIDTLLGYDREGAITITQTAPLKMTVLGLEYKISVG